MIFRNLYILVIISLGLAYANLSDKWDENVRPKMVVDYLQNKSKKYVFYSISQAFKRMNEKWCESIYLRD